MTHAEELIDVLERITEAGGRVVVKRGALWKALHWAVLICTLGRNRDFLEGYYTTIGPIVGVPIGWETRSTIQRVAVLSHELEHIEQCARLGMGSAWIGLIPFGLSYLLLPLPVGLAWCRWRYERAAYVKGINIELSMRAEGVGVSRDTVGGLRGWRQGLIDNAVHELTSGAYAWTWPFPGSVRKYFDQKTILIG